MSDSKRRSSRQRKIVKYAESSSEGDTKTKINSKQINKQKLKTKEEEENFEEPKTLDKSMEDEDEEEPSAHSSNSHSLEPETWTPTPEHKPRRTILTVKSIKSKLAACGGPKTSLSKSGVKGIKIKQKDIKPSKSSKPNPAPPQTPKSISTPEVESPPNPTLPSSQPLTAPLVSTSIEVDPIFRKFKFDPTSLQYIPSSSNLTAKDHRRINFITRIKVKLEAEKDRDEYGIPLTDLEVSSLSKLRWTKRPPLEFFSYTQTQTVIKPQSFSNEPLVHSTDAKRTNNRKIKEKQVVTTQKAKYAAKIGFVQDAKSTNAPTESSCDPEAELGTLNNSLSQVMITHDFIQNGDTSFDQMEWELTNKLPVKELEHLKTLKKRVIILVNNSLRTFDNYLLHKAIEISQKYTDAEILPIYVFNQQLFMPCPEGRFRSIQKTRFILENLQEMKEKLRKIGSDLIIDIGEPEEVLRKVIRNDRENFIVLEYEIAPKEKKAEEAVWRMALKNKTKVCRVWGATAVHIEDLPYGLDKFPHLFGKFKKDIANISIRRLLEEPKDGEMPFPDRSQVFREDLEEQEEMVDYIPDLEDFKFSDEEFAYIKNYDKRTGKDHFLFKGGEDYGNKVLNDYIWEKETVSKYFYSHVSFFINGDFAPKLTPWTSVGAISPRKIFLEILKYENKKGNSEQTEWFKREMLWKDYFIFWALKHHKMYFTAEYGIYNRAHYDWQTNIDIIEKVKQGKSGMPIIDAIVRELNESGYLSYKAKMIFSNYFSQDLRQDWRKGLEFFESKMIDYEPCEVVGKWHQGSGIGPGRIVKYNCLCQSQDHDSKGEYIRRWVKELEKVPDEYIHDPWRMPVYLQKEWNAIIGIDYPKPISCLRYTHENKTAHVDRTKALSKKEKLITENGQASIFAFVKVKDSKIKEITKEKFCESDKENDVNMEPFEESGIN